MASPIINIKFLADLAQFSSQMQNVNRQLDKTGKQFQNIGTKLSVGVTLPLLAAGTASIKYASDFEESLNKVNVAFGSSSGEVQAFAKTTLEQFGIAEGSALDMAALFGDMATSMQIPQKEAGKMSTALVGLAGDLASFKNIGISEATTALNGVFTGETESLKRLGVVMTQANLAQFALTQGITKSIQEMSEAEKVQLRYAFIMARTTNAQGDFNNTSGGAANQMRIFQESLKQVGQQFGSIILPVFTKAAVKVNEIITYISGLNSETKKTIVIGAAFAAALGPVVVVLGTIIRNVSTLIPLVKALTVTIAANPIGAFAVAITALAGGLLLANSRFTPLTNATKEFNELSVKASESIAQEKVQLDKLLRVAQNEKQSKEARAKAIESLNALSPKYLGNLNLENINTTAAKDATDAYTQSLLKKAKVMAAEEKLVEVQKKLLDLQLGQSEAGQLSFLQNVKAIALGLGNTYQAAIQGAKLTAQNLSTETQELLKLQDALTSFIDTNEDFKASTDGAVTPLDVTPPDVTPPGALDPKAISADDLLDIEGAKNNIESLKNLDTVILETGGALAAAVDNAGIENMFNGVSNSFDEFINTADPKLEAFIVGMEEKAARMAELGLAVGGEAAAAFESFAGSMINSLNLADTGFQGFVKNLAQTITKLIAMMLSQAIAQSIAGAVASGTGTGPAAIFTTPAFIATAVGGVLAAFAAIPKFAEGGIISGPTLALVGEYAGASSNPEVIAPLDKLKALIQPGGSGDVHLNGGFNITGDQIELILERAGKRRQRVT